MTGRGTVSAEVAEGEADEEDGGGAERDAPEREAAQPRPEGEDGEEDEHLLGEECAHKRGL